MNPVLPSVRRMRRTILLCAVGGGLLGLLISLCLWSWIDGRPPVLFPETTAETADPRMPGGRTLALLGAGSFFLGFLIRQIMTRLAQPRVELIEEVERISLGDLSGPVRLPGGHDHDHPYQRVADTINGLVDTVNRQERVITEQHHRQQVLLNNISEGILALDNDLRVTGVNPIAADWLGLGPPARVHGQPLRPPGRNATLLTLIEQVLATGEPGEARIHVPRGDGSSLRIELRGSLLVDKDQAEGVLVLLRDVTLLRRLETLRQDFVANVSHELRTPLTSIQGFAELLEAEAGDPETVARYNGKIISHAKRMVNIIDDLLALTRIESANAPPSVSDTEFRPLLENVIKLCRDAADHRCLDFKLDVEDGLSAPMHAPLFEQAVLNLAQNAVKYTHPRSEITLRAYRQGESCVVEVRDEGPGIAPQHQERIFERFYRVDKARSRSVGGTGLGLSIVKHIAQLHGGRVEVESELGHGATFRLSIPGE